MKKFVKDSVDSGGIKHRTFRIDPFTRNASLCRLFVGSVAAAVQIPLADVDTSWAGIECLRLNCDSKTKAKGEDQFE